MAPVALTNTRAVTTSRSPRALKMSRQTSLRSARTQRVRADHRAAFGGINRIEHDEARVVDKAAGIF
jgi:hypothetical protein